MPRWLPSLLALLAGVALALVWRNSQPGIEPANTRTTSDSLPHLDRSPAVARTQGTEIPAAVGPAPAAYSAGSVAKLRDTALPDALRRPGIDRIGAALAGFEQVGDDEARAAYLQSVLQFALSQDPASAADAADSLSGEHWRRLAVNFLLLHWGALDPRAALSWATDHPVEAGDASRFHTAYEGFAGGRPLDALHMLSEPALAADWDDLARVTIFHCDQAGQLARARAWIESLPEGGLRDLLVQQTAQRWAAREPEAAAQWLAGTASESAFRAGLGAVLQSLAETRPESAATLTQQFSEPEIRRERLADVLYTWAKRDLGGAAAWLRAQAASEHLDPARARLAEATAPVDRNEAKAWVNMISDPALRAELSRRLGL